MPGQNDNIHIVYIFLTDADCYTYCIYRKMPNAAEKMKFFHAAQNRRKQKSKLIKADQKAFINLFFAQLQTCTK